jgi:hypothetical protein
MHKVNELVIFTDATLTMKIANTSLKLSVEDMEKLQESLKAEMFNNNLVIKENCFVLNAIQEEAESSYGEFKDFPDANSSLTPEQQPIMTENKML